MFRTLASTVVLGAAALPVAASAREAAPPAAFQSVLDCRTVSDGADRLACFDAAVAGLASATAANDVIVVGKEEVERRERERFGAPALPALAGTSGEALDDLDTTVASIRYTPYGKLVLGLPDGATWEQIDSRELAREPKIGVPVRLRKATLGSFLVNVDGQTAIRMRRVDRRSR